MTGGYLGHGSKSNGMISIGSKIKNLFSELGALDAILYLIDRVLRLCGMNSALYHYVLVAQPLYPNRKLGRNRNPSWTFSELIPGQPALAHMPLTQEVLDYRFCQPTFCLCSLKEEELVAYIWFCRGPYEEDEVRCLFVPEPGDKAVWDFDVYVVPEYRFSRAFARLWDEANRKLGAMGYQWTLSRISAFNPASLAAHSRMGARKLASTVFLVLGSFQATVASVAPFIHISFTTRSRPVIRLQAPHSFGPGK